MARRVDLANVRMSINPFDEISLMVEEAVRLKEKGEEPREVVAVSIRSRRKRAKRCAPRSPMGADRGILVKHDGAAGLSL